jgi:quercetin dioxygenase-like cupin family protein
MTVKMAMCGLVCGLGLVGAFVPAFVAAKGKGTATFVPAAELKFADVPDMAGLQLAQLEGDPAKGPSHFMLKFAPGFSAPVHHHTANHSGTVVAGTLALTVDGEEHKLPPGSFFSFSNKASHATKCEAGAECLLSLDVRGKWDVVPEKTLAKK